MRRGPAAPAHPHQPTHAAPSALIRTRLPLMLCTLPGGATAAGAEPDRNPFSQLLMSASAQKLLPSAMVAYAWCPRKGAEEAVLLSR